MHMLVAWLFTLAAHEPTVPEERRALLALYEATGGSHWGAENERWLSGDPCGIAPYFCGANCQGWRGIHCWGPGGHVRKVYQHHMVGHLPTQIGLLSKLATLDLSLDRRKLGSGLSGTLPSELGLIDFRRTTADASVLRLDGQGISGSLPTAVAMGLPDTFSRCRLPSSMGCSAVGFPPACAGQHSCDAADQLRACPIRNNGAGGTLVPEDSLSADGAPLRHLCDALSHLGLNHALPAASAAEAVVRAGYSSLPALLNATPATLMASLSRVATAAHLPIATRDGSSARQHARIAAEALDARVSLRRQATLERQWAKASSQPLTSLQGRLRACCRRAHRLPATSTDGSWRSRKMHPCCSPLTPLRLMGQAVSRDGSGRRLGQLVRKLQVGESRDGRARLVTMAPSGSSAEHEGHGPRHSIANAHTIRVRLHGISTAKA